MPRRTPWFPVVVAGVLAMFAAACATLQQVVQPPIFSAEPGRQAEVRYQAPSLSRPLGAVGVRLWARVENPNPLGLNLTHLAGTLFLADTRAGTVDLPLGLPLPAQRDTVFPVEVSISLADIPGLASSLARAAGGSFIPYRLDGRFSVGTPAGSFDYGPQTLLHGNATMLR